MDYTALAAQLVSRCRALGADAAEVYIESARTLSIRVRNGDLETVQEASTAGAGLRVFVKNRMAFASTNDLRESALEQAASRAVAFAATTSADPNNVLPSDPGVTTVEGLYDASLGKVPMEKKIELVTHLEALAMKEPGITKSAGAGYGEAERETFLANSHGLAKHFRESSCSLGVSVVAEKGDQKQPGSESASRRLYADLPPAADLAARAAREAAELLDPRPVKTQRAAVIVHADVAASILGGVLQAVNGEQVAQGASFLGSRLNQQVASPLVTLIDDGIRPKGLASRPFDAEGVPTGRRVIVEQGVLKGFLYNTAVARRAGVASTGNAVRSGFASLPAIGPHNFYMLAGSTPLADIIKATRVGLLLRNVTGYGINPVNGNFSGGASGLWIENGAIVFPVKGLTIAGTAAEMLNGIDLVGTDLDLNRSFAAPSFRIREMQIGGE